MALSARHPWKLFVACGRSPFPTWGTGDRTAASVNGSEVVAISDRAERDVGEEISKEILRIHRHSYGKGAERAQTWVSDDFVIVVLDGLELLPNEEFLVQNGHGDAVHNVRTQYQKVIGPSFRAAVERATGKKVVGFASSTSLDERRFVCETFQLE